MPSRRSFLGLSAGILGAVGLGGMAVPAWAGASSPVALAVRNATGRFRDSQAWAHIVGTEPQSGRQGWVRPDGSFEPCELSDGNERPVDVAIPCRPDGTLDVGLPPMSGRVYFSVGQKLHFAVVRDAAGRPALRYPAGWVATDRDFGTVHDFVEFTLDGLGLHANATMVDMFGMPMTLTVRGSREQSTGALVPGGRAQIFAGLAADPVFAGSVVGGDLRVLAPRNAIDAGLMRADVLDSQIDEVWAHYRSTELLISDEIATFTGKINENDEFVFRGAGGTATILRPTTRDVLSCDGALFAPNDHVVGPIARTLGAAFNRSTLLACATQPTSDPQTFYRGSTTNRYAAVLHANSLDGKAYGFAFDDVAGQAAYVSEPNPVSIEVTLGPW